LQASLDFATKEGLFEQRFGQELRASQQSLDAGSLKQVRGTIESCYEKKKSK
jgi:hypothetical protein